MPEKDTYRRFEIHSSGATYFCPRLYIYRNPKQPFGSVVVESRCLEEGQSQSPGFNKVCVKPFDLNIVVNVLNKFPRCTTW